MTQAEWERREDEPAMWFSRFDELFRPMGPERSLLGAYNAWREQARKGIAKSPARSWSINAVKWEWRKRAEAWDAAQRERRLVEEETERKKRREERRSILQGIKAKVAVKIQSLEVDDLTANDLFRLVGLMLEQERIEWDDLPTHKVAQHHSGSVETVIREVIVELPSGSVDD